MLFNRPSPLLSDAIRSCDRRLFERDNKVVAMLNIILYVLACLSVCSFFMLLWLLTYKTEPNKEKSRPFERGFDPSGVTRLQFCMKFFLVGVIFLIFDVEVSLLLPMPFRPPFILLFFTILVIGLIFEWYYGGLE